MNTVGWLALASVCACGSPRLELVPPWPDDQVAVVAVLSKNGAVEGAPRVYRTGDAIELRVDTEQPRRILVRTYPAADAGGPDFGRCGVAIGGEGLEAPEPLDSWISTPIQRGEPIELVRQGAPTPIDVRLPGCSDDPTLLCDRIILTPIEVPLTGNFTGVAVPSDAAAFALLADDAGPDRRLLRLDAASGAVRTIDLGGGAVPQAISTDHHGVTWVALRDGRVMALDEAGRIAWTVETGLSAPKVAAGYDGTVIAYDPSAALEVRTTSTIAAARDDLPPGVEDLFIVDSDRMVAVVEGGLHVRDATVWSLEFSDPQVGAGWSGFGDDMWLGAIGAFQLLVREEASRSWSPISAPPTAQFTASGAVRLRSERILAVADVGYAGLVVEGRTCQIGVGTLRPLVGVDAAPGGAFAVIVGENEDRGTPPFMAIADLTLLPQ